MCTGPGNFTGIRTGYSAAKGLAFGLGIELIGVTLFEALAVSQKKCSVIFNNKFGKFLMQRFCNGKEITKVEEFDELEGLLQFFLCHILRGIHNHQGFEEHCWKHQRLCP